ncbi:hypothetical protein KEM60_01573 [Austwickia sp. TVS 96-490-7B]|uniref:acyl-CoA carboxylase epsilon subunit n=1 Tax=Austwickia sp. TVS 96-490-7B TaxID=2830843 RepID=UPI001C573E90|nr:acyl-CoA carboxylase epsilon subunit [Austwickia sp. TVS 96-490-7B]MBW3085376.1 hypothetical protein [Austwickia sp. TVS 96-490-7B]
MSDVVSAQDDVLFQVVRGAVDAEELAALTVVLLALLRGDQTSPSSSAKGWSRPSRSFNVGAARGAGWGAQVGG